MAFVPARCLDAFLTSAISQPLIFVNALALNPVTTPNTAKFLSARLLFMAKRCTREEANRRTETIARMLINGANAMECRAYARVQWGLKRHGIDHYMAAARKMIRENADLDRTDFVSQKLTTLELVLRKALETNQLNNAVGAIRLMADITGCASK